jgi:lysophospholipase L1-like esterase
VWKNVPAIPDRNSGAAGASALLVRILVPLAVVALLFIIGHRVMALVVAIIAGSILIASLASSAARHGIERAGAWLGHVVGGFLTVVLLGAVYFTVFALASAVLRILGRDPLRTRLEPGRSSYWGQLHRSGFALYRWQFAREPEPDAAPPAGGLLRRAVNFVVVFFVLNLAIGLFLHAIGQGDPKAPDVRMHSAAHQKDDWAAHYYAELQHTQKQKYAGFLGWRRHDTTGEYINIVDGIRHSYNSNASEGGINVYFFGGSTMWGIGNRDEHTIPSEFARLAEAAGIPVHVTNYGESGYVSWQEVLQLSELCALGQTPDLAIFYDGVNDTFVQIQTPTAKPLPQNFDDLALRFEHTGSLMRALSNYSAVNLLLKHIAVRRAGPDAMRMEVADLPGSVEELADNAAHIYIGSAEHARHLGIAYGFEVETFWQPNVYTKHPLRADEESMQSEFGPGMGALYAATTERVQGKTHRITDALDGVEEPVLVDWCHTNESGAHAVAQAIFAQVEPILSRMVQDQSGTWTRGSSSQ